MLTLSPTTMPNCFAASTPKIILNVLAFKSDKWPTLTFLSKSSTLASRSDEIPRSIIPWLPYSLTNIP